MQTAYDLIRPYTNRLHPLGYDNNIKPRFLHEGKCQFCKKNSKIFQYSQAKHISCENCSTLLVGQKFEKKEKPELRVLGVIVVVSGENITIFMKDSSYEEKGKIEGTEDCLYIPTKNLNASILDALFVSNSLELGDAFVIYTYQQKFTVETLRSLTMSTKDMLCFNGGLLGLQDLRFVDRARVREILDILKEHNPSANNFKDYCYLSKKRQLNGSLLPTEEKKFQKILKSNYLFDQAQNLFPSLDTPEFSIVRKIYEVTE